MKKNKTVIISLLAVIIVMCASYQGFKRYILSRVKFLDFGQPFEMVAGSTFEDKDLQFYEVKDYFGNKDDFVQEYIYDKDLYKKDPEYIGQYLTVKVTYSPFGGKLKLFSVSKDYKFKYVVVQ